MIVTIAIITAIAENIKKSLQQSLRSYGYHSPAIVAITASLAMVNIPECTASSVYSFQEDRLSGRSTAVRQLVRTRAIGCDHS